MVFGLKRKATAEKTPIFSPDQPPEEGIGIIFKVAFSAPFPALFRRA